MIFDRLLRKNSLGPPSHRENALAAHTKRRRNAVARYSLEKDAECLSVPAGGWGFNLRLKVDTAAQPRLGKMT